jgi:hypothetical protein
VAGFELQGRGYDEDVALWEQREEPFIGALWPYWR